MNKILTKTVKRAGIMSIVLATLLIAAFLIAHFFGLNYSATVHNTKTFTVKGGYFTDAQVEQIDDICKAEFKTAGVDVNYTIDAGRNGVDSELVYYFDYGTNLSEAEKAIDAIFAEKLSADGEWAGLFITTESDSGIVGRPIAWATVFRAVGAIALFAVLGFAYTSIRYGLSKGILTGASTVIGAITSATLTLLFRLPITVSSFYAIAVSALLTTVFVVFNLNKLRANTKSGEYADKSAEETVVASTAVKEILGFAITLGVALVLVGAIATTSTRWFALTAFMGLIAATFVGLIFAPALYLPLKKIADKRPVRTNKYKGAEKTSTRIKKIFQKKKKETESVEAPVETPVEEPVASVAEETTEEVVEETPVVTEENTEKED